MGRIEGGIEGGCASGAAAQFRAIFSALIICMVIAVLLSGPTSPANAGELGLALTRVSYGPWNDPEECPDGLAPTGRDMLMESISPELRAELEAVEKRMGSSSDYVTRVLWERRGPNGLGACANPTTIDEPDMPIGQAAVSEGFDLDGGDTGNHCPHTEFLGPNGEAGIDNQVRRLTACIRSKRGEPENRRRASFLPGAAETLLRVADIDSLEDDDDVRVEIYRARDTLVADTDGTPLPDASLRVDEDAPLFTAVTQGKIVGGVLTTEPVDVRISRFPSDYFIRDAKFKIEIGADGYSEGLLGGYFDIESLWDAWARNPSSELSFSCPAFYKSLHELADGHKDPETGRCTSLSVAFDIEAVRTFVILPSSGAPDS